MAVAKKAAAKKAVKRKVVAKKAKTAAVKRGARRKVAKKAAVETSKIACQGRGGASSRACPSPKGEACRASNIGAIPRT